MSSATAFVYWNGETLSAREVPRARRLGLDARCLGEDPGDAPSAWAHVCASTDEAARIPYDDPAVQQARRAALAWWIPLLGDRLVCLSTFSLDSVYCAGAVTVLREPLDADADPFVRLFPATSIRVSGFVTVPPPAGPVVERYGGAPWPAGRF